MRVSNSGFFEKTERTNRAVLDAYKDKKFEELLDPQHLFDVEFAQDIIQQKSDSLSILYHSFSIFFVFNSFL